MMTNVEIGTETKNAKRKMLLHLRGLVDIMKEIIDVSLKHIGNVSNL